MLKTTSNTIHFNKVNWNVVTIQALPWQREKTPWLVSTINSPFWSAKIFWFRNLAGQDIFFISLQAILFPSHFSAAFFPSKRVSPSLFIPCFLKIYCPFLLKKQNLTSKRNSWIQERPFCRNVCLEGNKSEAFLICLENKAF